MLQLRQLIPLNLEEEKARFFADNSYNPQFYYADSIDPNDLLLYGLPTTLLLEKAEKIIEANLPYQFIRLDENKQSILLSADSIQKYTETYLNAYDLNNRFRIVWKENAVARCSIQRDLITFRVDADYSRESLLGVLNHEIGTHALRRINDEKQPWHNNKNAYGFQNSLTTEEGLATIHQHLDDELPILFGVAVKYLAVNFAQTTSFAETWLSLSRYFRNPEKLWATVFRVKRGMTDTSKPGGFTKDIVYFKGVLEVSNWLRNNDFDVSKLYVGKISIEDIVISENIGTSDNIVLPIFFLKNKDEYSKKITSILTVNELYE